MNTLNRLTLFALLVSLQFCASAGAEERAKPAHKDANVEEFEKLTKEPGVVILDVRTPEEYQAGHLKGAIPIDYKAKDFDEKVRQLDRSKTYLVYCAVGGRSTRACEKLGKLDFKNLTNLVGGIKAWEREGKPVEK